jgi:hypothetical protein
MSATLLGAPEHICHVTATFRTMYEDTQPGTSIRTLLDASGTVR